MNQVQPPLAPALVVKIVRYAMVFAQIILFLVLNFSGVTEIDWEQANNLDELGMVFIPMAILAQVVSLFIYSKIDFFAEKLALTNQVKLGRELTEVEKKSTPYILSYAIMESSGILAFVLSLSTQNLAYLAVFGGLSIFWLLFVMKPKLDTQLS